MTQASKTGLTLPGRSSVYKDTGHDIEDGKHAKCDVHEHRCDGQHRHILQRVHGLDAEQHRNNSCKRGVGVWGGGLCHKQKSPISAQCSSKTWFPFTCANLQPTDTPKAPFCSLVGFDINTHPDCCSRTPLYSASMNLISYTSALQYL